MKTRDVTGKSIMTFGELEDGDVFTSNNGVLQIKAMDLNGDAGNSFLLDGGGTYDHPREQKVIRVEIVSLEYRQI